MLSSTRGMGFFVQIPDESKRRILHAALVEEVVESSYTARLKEDDVPLESGQNVSIFYELRGEFVRQPACTSALSHTESGISFVFQFTDKPVSAESRKCYRVSTVMAEVSATFGDEENCAVLDVSPTGFAVTAAKQHKVGAIVDAIVRFGDEKFSGQGRIESVRELSAGRIRYGLHCVDDKLTDDTLCKGLQQISAIVQRQHLRRLSRAG